MTDINRIILRRAQQAHAPKAPFIELEQVREHPGGGITVDLAAMHKGRVLPHHVYIPAVMVKNLDKPSAHLANKLRFVP